MSRLTPHNPFAENAHFGEDRIQSAGLLDRVTDETRAEIELLKQQGVKVEIVPVDLSGHYQLPKDKQELVDHAIEVYSEIPDFADQLVSANSSVAGWLSMAKSMSPLALSFFYNTGTMERPSDGLSKDAILNSPLAVFGGKTAAQMVNEMHTEENAAKILGRLDEFFAAGSLKDGVDGFGLTAHDIMAGSLDRIGDVTRAKDMMWFVKRHIQSNPETFKNRGAVLASFASGLGEPMYWLLNELKNEGIVVDHVHQVDLDPIALSANAQRTAEHGLEGKITMHHQNLILSTPDSYIDPHSVDALELVGFIEYFKKSVASRVLKRAATVVRTDGMIVFGNMLRSRPQQKWFEGLWPALQQRSITEVLELIEDAGYSRDQVEIRLSADGLYAIFAIYLGGKAEEQPLQSDTNNVVRGLGRATRPATV